MASSSLSSTLTSISSVTPTPEMVAEMTRAHSASIESQALGLPERATAAFRVISASATRPTSGTPSDFEGISLIDKHRINVLYLEDDKFIGNFTKTILESDVELKEKVNFIWVKTFEEASRLYDNHKEDLPIAILDHELGEKNTGTDLMNKIRLEETLGAKKICIISNSSHTADSISKMCTVGRLVDGVFKPYQYDYITEKKIPELKSILKAQLQKLSQTVVK